MSEKYPLLVRDDKNIFVCVSVCDRDIDQVLGSVLAKLSTFLGAKSQSGLFIGKIA